MKKIQVNTRRAWRTWLGAHHDSESTVWLVFHKKEAGKPTLDYGDAVEEALCFGWVDSIIKNLDETKYARKFTPRKPNSNWSASNKARVTKLIEQGLMTDVGLAKVDAAKSSGRWDQDASPDISFEMPDDLKIALDANDPARDTFEALAPSYQKQYLGWILTAKRPKTRATRIREAVVLLAKGEKLGMK